MRLVVSVSSPWVATMRATASKMASTVNCERSWRGERRGADEAGDMENLSAMRVGGDGAAAYSAASPLQHPEKTFMHETSQLALGAAAVGLAGTWAWRQRLALRPVHRASAIALALFLAAHLLGHLALFLLIHVTAVLAGRFQGVDTNLQFAAAGMHTPPWQWFFGPYYFFAVFALGTHVGCALYWNLPEPLRARALVGAMLAGWMLAVCLVVLLAGGFHALEIPARYLAPLAGLAGRG